MARDLSKERDKSIASDGNRTDVSGGPRGGTAIGLASELASDAYNIVVALAILSLSYWLVFRNLPAELFTLGLATLGLIAMNVVVALRRRSV